MTSSATSSGKTPTDTTAPGAGWLDGVCLVANAIPGSSWSIPASQAEIREAVGRIALHDWCESLTGDWECRLLPAGTPESFGPHVGVRRDHPDAWWHGFADALNALAGIVTFADASPRPEAVAVVGLPLDRLEPDRIADRDEVVRLIAEGVGLEVVSVWPSGEGPRSLGRATEAGLVVSLPHGREAGRTLVRRTGAVLIEAGLPVGLAGTARFVREVARAAGRDAESFLGKEMRRYIPRIEWLIPHALLHLRVRVEADPWTAEAITAFLCEVGCRVTNEGPPDLVIGPRPAVERAAVAGMAFLENGFPSPGSHGLHPTPARFGFEGAMHLLEAIANRLSQWETVEKTRRDRSR